MIQVVAIVTEPSDSGMSLFVLLACSQSGPIARAWYG